jgi:hypothetical protein
MQQHLKNVYKKLFAVIASAVAFSHEAEGRGGKQSRVLKCPFFLDRHGAMRLAMTSFVESTRAIKETS